MDDLRPWASPRQVEILDAIAAAGSMRGAGRTLGVGESTVRATILRLKAAAASKGYSPEHDMTRTVPDPFVVRGHSTYYNKEGKVGAQWVKTRVDDNKLGEIITAAVAEMCETIPRLPITPLPRGRSPEAARLLTQYTLTDVHIGMLAWHQEGGANWDLKIAERTVMDCLGRMIERSPPADTALIAQLGDWFHQLARTIFHGKRGELRQRYREGQEDQLGALGLVVNLVVLWNTIYMDAALNQLITAGYDVKPEDVDRLSPLGLKHINMLGRYAFTLPDSVARGELRPLRDPSNADGDDA
jgi:hypothetical protein